MQRISPPALAEVQNALLGYEKEVDASDLAEKSKWTYLRHAETFTRWLAGDFAPGERVKR